MVARERLRAEVDTRLAGVAFGSDSDVCVDPGSLVKAAVRAVGKQVSEKNSAVNNVFGVRVLEDRTITYKACSTICWYVEPDLIKLMSR